MATSRSSEDRFLDTAERELVEQTRHPQLSELKPKDLADLTRRIRERRNRARDIAKSQRRNVRGKGAGTAKDGAERGNAMKASILAQALQRVNKEAARRGEDA